MYPARLKPSTIRARRSLRPQGRRCQFAHHLGALSALSFLSIVNTYSYNLASYRVSRLQAISTKTHLLLTDWAKTYKHDNEIMCSFDVTSLFTNVPLDEKIHICFDKLELYSLPIFRNYLVLRYRKYIKFDSPYFDQIDRFTFAPSFG